jgi:Rieske Fe-S protein
VSNIERRRLLAAVAAAGAAIPLVAACGGDDSTNPDSGTTTSEATTPAETTTAEATPTEEPSPSEDPQSGGNAIAKTSDIPVGGGTIIGDQKIVVTQPTAGEFKAFSNICTHQRCRVSSVANGLINCKCHNSAFSIEDGSVKGGPASSPLPETPVRVDGSDIISA